MTKAGLLSTVAASLLLSAGIASAQSPSTQPPERAPAAQQHAPAEKVAPPMRGKGSETTGQSSQGMKPGAASDEHPSPGTSGQAPNERNMTPNAGTKGSSDMKRGTDTRSQRDDRGSVKTNDSANEKSKSDMRENKAEGAKGSKTNESAAEKKSTTGQGAAAGSAKLSTEQRTKITTIIKRQKVEPAHLNVSIRVGTRIPNTVRFYQVPVEVVDVYPEWRGYDYILVGAQIVILDPRTHEIVAVLDA